jgi:hypothetical protein
MNATSSPIRAANRWALSRAAVVCAALAHGCASNAPPDPRYPRRSPGCELSVYHTPIPGVAAWDDLGVAEAYCNIGGAVADCMRALKAEACRMGGDLLYNVPRTPRRPRPQVMQLLGQVAHTRARWARGEHEGEKPPEKDDDAPPPASAEEAAGPVVPLPSGERPGDPAVDGPPATPASPPAPPPPKAPAP